MFGVSHAARGTRTNLAPARPPIARAVATWGSTMSTFTGKRILVSGPAGQIAFPLVQDLVLPRMRGTAAVACCRS